MAAFVKATCGPCALECGFEDKERTGQGRSIACRNEEGDQAERPILC